MSDVDHRTLGSRIREARERAGLSQSQLAEQIGLDRTAVNKVESGTRKLSAVELSDVAVALGVRMASFFQDPIPALVAHRQRHDRETTVARIDRVLEGLAMDVELVESLAPEPLGLTDGSGTLGTVDVPPLSSVDDADALAIHARELIGLDQSEPAVDLVHLVGRLGLLAFSIDLGIDSADAATILLRRGGVSLINSSTKSGRRRLALAHELGHYLAQDQYTVDWRVADNANTDVEALLDRFARSFLLPEIGLREAWQSNTDREVREIAVILGSQFRVDMSTLARRALDLGLVHSSEADQIRKVSTTKADFVDFGLNMQPEMEGVTLPVPYQRAVLQLVRGERISADRALDLMRDTFTAADLPSVRPRRDDELWNFVS